MDPNANLLEQERLLRILRTYPTWKAERARLRELRKALSDWLAAKGFEPDWNKAPNASKYYGRKV